MRSSIMLFAAAAMAIPAPALADGCPERITAEFETSLGETVGWLEAGQTVHTPTGMTMFGVPISYVVVKREGDSGPILEVDYRFQGVTRPAGQQYPDNLRKAFDAAFSTSGCARSRDAVCAVAYDSAEVGNGKVSGGKLSMGDLWVPDEARGLAVPLVQADVDAANGDPVYLVCLY